MEAGAGSGIGRSGGVRGASWSRGEYGSASCRAQAQSFFFALVLIVLIVMALVASLVVVLSVGLWRPGLAVPLLISTLPVMLKMLLSSVVLLLIGVMVVVRSLRLDRHGLGEILHLGVQLLGELVFNMCRGLPEGESIFACREVRC